jgi:hypothetical protein
MKLIGIVVEAKESSAAASRNDSHDCEVVDESSADGLRDEDLDRFHRFSLEVREHMQRCCRPVAEQRSMRFDIPRSNGSSQPHGGAV